MRLFGLGYSSVPPCKILQFKYWLHPLRYDPIQRWNRSGFSQPTPTVKFQNLRRSTAFFQKVFVHCSMHLMKNFQKGGMGEVLKFVTPDGRRVANGQTSSGPKPARAWKYKPKPGPNPKTNLKPKSCPKKNEN